MTIRTRFAPSPNGPLHLGHAYAAVIAHDLARARGGAFLVRIEDIDAGRSRAQLIPELLADLAWLGLSWDEAPVYQSVRLASYAAAAEQLAAMGLLYPCTCTRAQVAVAARTMGPDGPVYPGTCRGRRDASDGAWPGAWAGAEAGAGARAGAGAAWRIDMARSVALAGPLWWDDALAGRQAAQPELFGDVVMVRGDAPASYHLAASLDDAAAGITLVTRGFDLFAASHIHRLLQALLSLPVPRWHHHALVIESDGRKLAKRRGSPALADLRRGGADGAAVAEAMRAGRFPAGLSLGRGLQPEP